MNTNTIEQRGATRFPASGNVVIMLNDNEACLGQLKDISDSGIFVATTHTPSDDWVDENAEIQITSVIEGKRIDITGDIRVIRVTPKGLGLFINSIHNDTRMAYVKMMIHVRQQRE